MKFCYLILIKIITFVSTRCQILRLKCIKFDFGWGSAPDPRWGSLQRSPRPPSWYLRGLLLWEGKGKEGGGGGKDGKRERGGEGRRGKEREGTLGVPPPQLRNPGYANVYQLGLTDTHTV